MRPGKTHMGKAVGVGRYVNSPAADVKMGGGDAGGGGGCDDASVVDRPKLLSRRALARGVGCCCGCVDPAVLVVTALATAAAATAAAAAVVAVAAHTETPSQETGVRGPCVAPHAKADRSSAYAALERAPARTVVMRKFSSVQTHAGVGQHAHFGSKFGGSVTPARRRTSSGKTPRAPKPNCPASFAPHAHTRPVEETATQCLAPHAMPMIRLWGGANEPTGSGVGR